MTFNRDDAIKLLNEFTKSDSLIKHALAVEAAMRAYARKFSDDEEEYGIVGLLHDYDYEVHPDRERHPARGGEIMRERGWPEHIIQSIMSHANYMNISRTTNMMKSIYACDELCGFLVACALIRPSRSLDDLEVSSVRKKMKTKQFAASVSREEMLDGARELGIDFDEHVRFVIDALRPIQSQLGLQRI